MLIKLSIVYRYSLMTMMNRLKLVLTITGKITPYKGHWGVFVISAINETHLKKDLGCL